MKSLCEIDGYCFRSHTGGAQRRNQIYRTARDKRFAWLAFYTHVEQKSFNGWDRGYLGRQRRTERRISPSFASTPASIEETGNTDVKSKSHPQKVWNLPTTLTVLRVFAIPILIGAWFSHWTSGSVLPTGVFLGASITDFLDGYLARKMDLTTAFGAFLDPVADKLMVATVLILLSTQPLPAGVWAGNAWFIPFCTCIVIGREITMSALREWAASLGPEAYSAVAVSQWGKWKTASQMAALTLLLGTSHVPEGDPGFYLEHAATLGTVLLLIATLLTVVSLLEYIRGLWPVLSQS
eukprot:jgi/Botrbrau1/2082/Bobra.0047s0043.1